LKKAICDPAMEATITRRLPLVYAEGESASADRPPFVLAASGLATLGEYLFVVQDNANWLAIVHPDESVTAVALPRGADGARVFSKDRENTDRKVDLEACVMMEGPDGAELIAFGSGTGDSSCWILRLTRPDLAVTPDQSSADDCSPQFLDAAAFYATLRANSGFSGGRLNIEGAIALDNDRILLLQRGNAPAGEGEPVDATGVVSWAALRAHLEDPSAVEPPALEDVTRYDLGAVHGVRLTFSDAEYLGAGRILYSASAEDPDSGDVAGSVLGLIEPGRDPRWATIICEDGTPFTSKIEGLSLVPGEPSKVRFVIDDDDESAPSHIFEAELNGGFDLARKSASGSAEAAAR
jgi:hypothetical protein